MGQYQSHTYRILNGSHHYLARIFWTDIYLKSLVNALLNYYYHTTKTVRGWNGESTLSSDALFLILLPLVRNDDKLLWQYWPIVVEVKGKIVVKPGSLIFGAV